MESKSLFIHLFTISKKNILLVLCLWQEGRTLQQQMRTEGIPDNENIETQNVCIALLDLCISFYWKEEKGDRETETERPPDHKAKGSWSCSEVGEKQHHRANCIVLSSLSSFCLLG